MQPTPCLSWFHGLVLGALVHGGAITAAGIVILTGAETEDVERALVELVHAGLISKHAELTSLHCFKVSPSKILKTGCRAQGLLYQKPHRQNVRKHHLPSPTAQRPSKGRRTKRETPGKHSQTR